MVSSRRWLDTRDALHEVRHSIQEVIGNSRTRTHTQTHGVPAEGVGGAPHAAVLLCQLVVGIGPFDGLLDLFDLSPQFEDFVAHADKKVGIGTVRAQRDGTCARQGAKNCDHGVLCMHCMSCTYWSVAATFQTPNPSSSSRPPAPMASSAGFTKLPDADPDEKKEKEKKPKGEPEPPPVDPIAMLFGKKEKKKVVYNRVSSKKSLKNEEYGGNNQ